MGLSAQQATEYCRELVEKADRDRYLSSLLAGEGQREALWALYAFNVELAGVREAVSEPQLGEIRLQWWRDEIAGIYAGQTPEHPVGHALAAVIGQAGLAQASFDNMIEARRFDLYDDPMPSMNDLEGYLGETASMLMQMAARVLAGQGADRSAEVSGLAGVAYGITGLLRSLPIHCARGQCFIPGDLLAKHDLTPAHVLSRKGGEQVGHLIKDLAGHASNRLDEARAGAQLVPKAALPAYWPASLADIYLPGVLKAREDSLRQVTEVSQLRVQAKLWWMAVQQRF